MVPWSLAVLAVVAFLIAKWVVTAVYRLFFHPLAKIPGPKLAAISWNYERYFDVYKGAQFWRQIGELHKQYGPIVRINPNEVHVAEPEMVDTVYPSGVKKVNKDPYLMSEFGVLNDAAFMTIEHDVHRMRRAAMNKYFSKAAVGKLESYIRQSCEKFAKRLLEHANTGPLRITSAYSSFTTDVVSEYCFGFSFQYMDRFQFEPNMHAAANGFGDLLPTLRMLPWLGHLMRLITPQQLIKINPEMGEFLAMEAACEKIVIEAKTRLSDKRAPTGYYTIVDELLRADLPEVEKRTQRLALETQGLIAAANETTGTSLSLATYYLYSNKAKFKKLEEELLALSPDRSIPSLAKLEALPYLGAVVIEVLRLSGGPLSRLPRVFPEDATVLRSSHKGQVVEYTVPPGTVLSMSSFYVHRNPELFPNPEEFSPERWLDEKGKRKKEKERYLLHFSKGTRGCVGLNLANAEMYLTIAALVLQVGERLELFETGVRDVTPDYDGFAPRVYRGSKGIRVVIK